MSNRRIHTLFLAIFFVILAFTALQTDIPEPHLPRYDYGVAERKEGIEGTEGQESKEGIEGTEGQESKEGGEEGDFSLSTKKAMLAKAYSELDEGFGRNGDDVVVPEGVSYDRMFVTFLTNNTIRCSQSGSTDDDDAKRTKKDIEEAIDDCIKDDRFGGEHKEEEVDDTSIVFNILRNKRKVPSSMNTLKREMELGIHAVEVRQGSKRAYFKESVPISKNYSLEKTMERLCKKAKLSSKCADDDSVNVYLYDTVGFTGDRDGNVTDLYRYNTMIDVEDISNTLLTERLGLAADWFVNNVDDDGVGEYLYYPSKDSYEKDINEVRMLGTAWSMAVLRNQLQDDRLASLVTAALDRYLVYRECEDGACHLDVPGGAKLAYNAFIILTLLEHPEYPEHEAIMEEFAEGILSQQGSDGAYKTYFNSSKNSGQDFYPGEAMLALMLLYEETGEARYLESVQKAFPHYREYWRGNKNTAFIPWHSQVDLLLYKATEDPEVASFVFEMNDWLIAKHQIRSNKWADEVGGFPKSLPRYSTSSYLEGINDAYAIAVLVNDQEHIEDYRETIRLGTRFVLLSQYTPENSFYIENGTRAVGGFRKNLVSNEQRNDYTQHAVFAMLKAIENRVF